MKSYFWKFVLCLLPCALAAWVSIDAIMKYQEGAGGEGRVEIILPTGGTYRTEKAEKAWNDLLKAMEGKWEVKNLEVGRGKVLELADRIQHMLSESIWEKTLFGTPETRKKLIKNT